MNRVLIKNAVVSRNTLENFCRLNENYLFWQDESQKFIDRFCLLAFLLLFSWQNPNYCNTNIWGFSLDKFNNTQNSVCNTFCFFGIACINIVCPPA